MTQENPTARRETIKAIVQDEYGSADVLELEEIDRPVVGDNDLLLRVHTASVFIGDWHIMTGIPYVFRMANGLRKAQNPGSRTGCRGSCRGGRQGRHAVSAGR